MSEKRMRQIERKIDRIKETLPEIGPLRPGSLTRQYRDPPRARRGLLADQLHAPDEESDRVRQTRMGRGNPQTDCGLQAVQAHG
jgi:hypothetical protein